MAKSRRGYPRKDAAAKARETQRRAAKADYLGRKVPPTVEAYEKLARKGDKKFGQALIARHTLRMRAIHTTDPVRLMPVMSALAPVLVLDLALIRLGASPNRPPAAYTGTWVDHLAWGVDSAVAAVRLLLAGQIVGAAAIARNQLERWTLHRAAAARLEQQTGESTVAFVARTWSSEDHFDPEWFSARHPTSLAEDSRSESGEPSLDHKHVTISDGSVICPAVLYELLSEVMHGRELTDAIAWDSGGLLEQGEWPDGMYAALGVVTDTVTLCLREIRLAAASLADQSDSEGIASLLKHSLDTFSIAEGQLEAGTGSDGSSGQGVRIRDVIPQDFCAPPLAALAPLLPGEGLSPAFAGTVVEMAQNYNAVLSGKRPAGRLFRDDEMATYAFGWHRARSVRAASRALDLERRQLGSKFNLDVLSARSVSWIMLTESASLLGRWHERPESAAASTLIGTATRSAYWLWLEDDDRAMSVLRCVLEQVARLRAWRLKPAKAEILEQRPETTPRDWLECAGWKRLAALNKALGELAHTKETSRWSGARELLAKLQLDVDEDQAIYTARGASIDFVAELAAQELIDEMYVVSESLSTAFRDVFIRQQLVLSTTRRSFEEHFNHIWGHRSEGMGVGDFVRMPELWPRGSE